MSLFYENRVKRNGIAVPIQCIDLPMQPSPYKATPHYHEYIELLYGVEGEATISIDTNTYLLPAGSMILVHAGVPHNAFCESEACRVLVIKFLPQVLRAEEETVSEYACVSLLMEQAIEKQFFFPAAELENTNLPILFRHAVEEWNRQAFGYELSLRADVTLIYLHILRQWYEKNRSLVDNIQKTQQGEFVQKAVSFVQQHFADLTEADAAAACGMSTSYFSRLFKSTMKTPFSTYVAKVRLKEAERLLLLTDKSVTDIAQTVGFSTVSYFISLFRRENGITPYQYRRLYRT